MENYRSSRHIISAANQLIKRNRDRMKGDHPIRINRERAQAEAGGRWARLDPVAQGRVQVIDVADNFHQAAVAVAELQRLAGLDPDFAGMAAPSWRARGPCSGRCARCWNKAAFRSNGPWKRLFPFTGCARWRP
ncbi:hypothetical protein [Desulfosarcina cetonica]|uniref:hypothetical protein n=1 Tax=Desulfosarcina cetonica TaxID=90730 RepID=UPI0006D1CF80|nr:hypothetical protein [Desulfosarcina cetonica]